MATSSFAHSQEARLVRRRYYPDNGIEVPAITESQMREVDRIATEETGPDLLYRIERAGLALALLSRELLEDRASAARILVLAGRGACGETGICAARHLNEQRLPVALCLSNPPFAGQLLSYQHRLYETCGGETIELWNLHEKRFDLIVEVLTDYRSSGNPGSSANALIRWIGRAGAPVLSFDVPSGVDATTGRASRDFVRAHWTLTAGLPKTGLNPETCGDLYLADVGLRPESLERNGIPYVSPFENRLWTPLACAPDEYRMDW